MRPARLVHAAVIKKADVHRPTHVYIGRKGTPRGTAHRYNAVVKVRVSPVGPTKVIGCPASIA